MEINLLHTDLQEHTNIAMHRGSKKRKKMFFKKSKLFPDLNQRANISIKKRKITLTPQLSKHLMKYFVFT